MARKKKGRAINGVILLDKPQGMTSNFALQKVRRLFGAQKAGHTGSLDPLATGVLPICLGEATKFSQYLLDANKGYITTAKLGDTRTTSDSEGECVKLQEVPNLSVPEILQVLAKFTGPIDQVPTMFSALKHQGKPLYEYARQGITIDRPARPITIFELELIEQRYDELDLKVACSKGTYIRTLVDDIGQTIGCGAHVSMLRRYQAGDFCLSQTVTMEELEGLSPQVSIVDFPEEQAQIDALFVEIDEKLLSIDSLLPELTKILLKNQDASSILLGQAVKIPTSEILGIDHNQLVALYVDRSFIQNECVNDQNAQEIFLGVAEFQADGSFQPKRLINV
ncbi:MAG: tRNA pseudouridine55 synthase [Oleiphilaceae bacterium]